ncbi:hypothetical protein INR49_010853 [Caranx melampygus]|nr:hypothetical protein INR49_010853 [Caranx melampygus]
MLVEICEQKSDGRLARTHGVCTTSSSSPPSTTTTPHPCLLRLVWLVSKFEPFCQRTSTLER